MGIGVEAEDFYKANTAAVDAIVEGLRSRGVPDSALDELIHEGAENDGVDSEEASSLNNQGFSHQVAWILQGNGMADGAALVEKAAEEALRSGPTP
jgi:hypothetical protein